MGERLTRPVEKPAVRRRGRKPDGKTKTIHQYAARVHAVVTAALTRLLHQPTDINIIAQEIVSDLERPFIITTGTRAGWSVSGLAHDQENIRRAFEVAVIAAYELEAKDPIAGSIDRRRARYLTRRPRGRRALANAITLSILTLAGRAMEPESLHRITHRVRRTPDRD